MIFKRIILIVVFLACVLSHGQARQRGIIEFNSIAELKNTPLQPQDSDFALVMSADGITRKLYNYEPNVVADEIQNFALDNFIGSWVLIKNYTPLTQYTQLSGRFEIDFDYDWASWADLNFGPSLQDWDLDIADTGPNGEPVIDWDGIGLAFPAGAVLKNITLKMRSNNDDVDEIQFFARAHDADLTIGNAVDSNAEIGAVNITPLAIPIDLDDGAAQSNDMRVYEISLNDYTFQNMGDLHLYMKATNGTLTANRQIRCTVIIEWQLP